MGLIEYGKGNKFLIGFLMASCFFSRAYSADAEAGRPLYLGRVVTNELVRAGACSTLNDCIRREHVFIEYKRGAYISVYGILDRRLMSEISAAVLSAVGENFGRYPVVIAFYPKRHSDYLGVKGVFKSPEFRLEVK